MTAPLGPILVATDFSGHALHAAARAARLAQGTHSGLTLMHVLPAQPATKIHQIDQRGFLQDGLVALQAKRAGPVRPLEHLVSQPARGSEDEPALRFAVSRDHPV